MAYESIIYEKKNHIAYVTLNRPEVLNAMHAKMHEELNEVFDDFQNDPDSWVAIYTGAGDRAFSAGNDLKITAAQSSAPSDAPPARPTKPFGGDGGFGGITARYDCWKPIIAAVNGWCVGGGFETALACDLIIAADHARFGLPEPKRGLIAGVGGVHRLVRQVPLKVGMGMLLTGDPIDAAEAHRLGLVNEVVPLADLIPAAERWAERIMACAPLAVRGCKQAAMLGLELPLETAIIRPYSEGQALSASPDSKEGPRAFAEKRDPVWVG